MMRNRGLQPKFEHGTHPSDSLVDNDAYINNNENLSGFVVTAAAVSHCAKLQPDQEKLPLQTQLRPNLDSLYCQS